MDDQDESNKSSECDDNVITDLDSVSCPICLEIFVSPKITTCGHTFCENCLENYRELAEPKCPVCRTVFIPSALVNATEIEKIINANKALCSGCHQQINLGSFYTHLNTCEKALCLVKTENDSMPKKIVKDVPNRHTFRCPYCGLENLDTSDLLLHVNENHRSSRAKVVCPICAAMPWGDPTQKSSNFIAHINIRHQFEYDTLVDYELDDDAALQKVLQASLEDK